MLRGGREGEKDSRIERERETRSCVCTSEIAIEKRRDRAIEGGREGEKERANEAKGREIKRGKREVRPIEEDGARETCGEAAHSRHSRENERVGTPYARGSRGPRT